MKKKRNKKKIKKYNNSNNKQTHPETRINKQMS